VVGTIANKWFLHNDLATAHSYTAGNFEVDGTFTLTGSTAVSSILDEDNMASDSATALATQQSIKAYADGKVSDTAYDATSWNAVTTIAPSKNAVRDQIETMLTSIATKQIATTQTLSDGANISWNIASGNHATVTLAGNRTLDNPTNMVAGQMHYLIVIQDGTGGRTLSFGSAYLFEDAIDPSVSSGASDKDIFQFYCDGTNMINIDSKFNVG
jgi:hypothetical protein